MHSPHQTQILGPGQMQIQIRFFWNVADLADEVRVTAANSNSVVTDLAFRWRDQPDEHFDRGAFPRTVRTEIADYLTTGNTEADVLHRWNSAIPLRQVHDFQHFELLI